MTLLATIDGTPDPFFSFGVGGIFDSGRDDCGSRIALDADGNIYLAGSINNGAHTAIWRCGSSMLTARRWHRSA